MLNSLFALYIGSCHPHHGHTMRRRPLHIHINHFAMIYQSDPPTFEHFQASGISISFRDVAPISSKILAHHTCRGNASLVRHNKSPRHIRRVKRGDAPDVKHASSQWCEVLYLGIFLIRVKCTLVYDVLNSN